MSANPFITKRPESQTQTTPKQSGGFKPELLPHRQGVAALFALAANLLDVILGFGETDNFVYGAKSATDWFALFQENWFKGLYVLGVLNIVYMAAMVPVYFGLFAEHRDTNRM
jgi:hypothetical protein